MMKALLKAIALMCVASMVAGFAYAHHCAEQRNYETRQFCERVHAGDTLDLIAEQYYNADNEGVTWQEFRYRAMRDNEHLTKDGRYLQPGDVVCITARVRVAK